MDRRHGKRPLPSEASKEEEKKDDDDLTIYGSSLSETDVSAMVTALSRVIGTSGLDDSHGPQQHAMAEAGRGEPPPRSNPDQGTYTYRSKLIDTLLHLS